MIALFSRVDDLPQRIKNGPLIQINKGWYFILSLEIALSQTELTVLWWSPSQAPLHQGVETDFSDRPWKAKISFWLRSFKVTLVLPRCQPCRCLGWSKYHCNLLCFLAFRANCALCLCLRWNLFSLSFIISLVTPSVKQQIDGQKVWRNCLRNYSLISFQSNLLSTHLVALIFVHL